MSEKSRIYLVGDGKSTQCAMRADGVWFVRRTISNTKFWGKWLKQDDRPFEFSAYLDPKGSMAVLPND
jgi:hypothetical protein